VAQKGNKNAFKHGGYAKEVLLPNESAEEFEQLYQAFRSQFNPIGEAEESVVRDLVGIVWVKNRLNGSLRRAFELSELAVSQIGESPLDIIVRSQAELAFLKNMTLGDRERVFHAACQLAEITRNPLYNNVDDVLKLREQLDRSFDKGVKRLVSLKEFQRLYGAKPIEKLPKAEPTSIAPDQANLRTTTEGGKER
jgi:hypothetical protein